MRLRAFRNIQSACVFVCLCFCVRVLRASVLVCVGACGDVVDLRFASHQTLIRFFLDWFVFEGQVAQFMEDFR